MKRSVVFASLVLASGLLLTNMYTSLVDLPAWSHQLPRSLETARQYYSHSNPGNFFRIFSPLNQVLGLLSLLLFWKRNKETRHWLGAAFLLYVVAEGLTFMYFYPRNAVLFSSQPIDGETLQATVREWSGMNWVRSLVVLLGVICPAFGLNASYRLASAASAARATQRSAVAVAG